LIEPEAAPLDSCEVSPVDSMFTARQTIGTRREGGGGNTENGLLTTALSEEDITVSMQYPEEEMKEPVGNIDTSIVTMQPSGCSGWTEWRTVIAE